NNTIDTGTDFGIYINGSAGNIRQNTIRNCGTGIFNNSTTANFNFNNIYNNPILLMTNQSTPNSSIVNAEYNYWGTADANVIRQKTTDYYDDPINYGKIDFSPFYDSIISDTGGPSNPVITINNGDTVSYALTVNLNLSAVNATQMMISETGTFSDTDWQPYTASCSFTFTPGNGLRYLYAKFKNAFDTESAIVFDDIYLEVAGEDSGPTYISDKILLYDKTWTAKGSPYIITENYLIPSGVKLTIEPGAEIRFDTNVELVIDGALWSVGIADSQILFTSNQTAKTKGHWKWIKYRNTAIAAQSKISHSKIEYGTQGLIFESVSVAVDNCQIDSHSQYGIYATNYSGSIDTSIINSISGNDGIYVSGGSPKIRNTEFKNGSRFGIYLNQCPNFIIINDTIQNNAN
ncbi:MAG TPA: right-handed parallel beta-helix repeat-containing protein, partial [bacterium]|nr:right-handed parallel beta-helix repeat-containing protein [bacterium]